MPRDNVHKDVGAEIAAKTALGDETPESTTFVPRKKKRKLKPEDFPKRPLSAYNIFFKENRAKVMLAKQKKQKGRGSDDESNDLSMVKHVSNLWKAIDPKERARIERLAEEDLERYKDEVQAYEMKVVIQNQKERERNQQERELLPPPMKKSKKKAQEEQVAAQALLQQASGSSSDVAKTTSGRYSPNEPAFESRGELQKSGVVSSSLEEGLEDELDLLLAEESQAMDMVRRSKIKQMRLVRQSHNPKLAASLDARRQALGLSRLLDSAESRERPNYNIESTRPGTGHIGREGSGGLPPVADARLDRMPPSLPPPTAPGFGLRRDISGGSGQGSENYLHPEEGALRRLDVLYKEEARLRMMLRDHEMLALHRPPVLYNDAPMFEEVAPLERQGLHLMGSRADLAYAAPSSRAFLDPGASRLPLPRVGVRAGRLPMVHEAGASQRFPLASMVQRPEESSSMSQREAVLRHGRRAAQLETMREELSS